MGEGPASPPAVSGRRPSIRQYLAAVGFSLAFVALRLGLEPVLQGQAPLIVLLAAPILAAWYGGLGPGLLATLLSGVLGESLFVAPSYSPWPDNPTEWLRLAIFLAYGALFSWLMDNRGRALRQAQAESEQLRQAQLLLADREQRARETLEASPSGMLVVRRDGRIELVNRQAERLFGMGREQMVGMSVDALVPEAVRAGHAANRQDFLRAPMARPMGEGRDLRARRADGTDFPVEVGLNPMEGEPAGRVLASVIDISQRKHAEEALREAHRRKDDFIALLAHELRNPLAPVRSAVEVLRRSGSADERGARMQAVIARQVDHMARLIDDLLDVSRIARGKLELRLAPCDLAAVARQTAEDYRASLDAAGLRLVVEVGQSPLPVLGDAVRLAQVLGNLLTNARRFNNPQGQVHVSAGTRADDTRVWVCVSDTGVGIDPELMRRLFDPLEQAPQDLARSRGGLGLGLALSRGLAQLHGGTVEAASRGAGQGAQFTLLLPRAGEKPAEN